MGKMGGIGSPCLRHTGVGGKRKKWADNGVEYWIDLDCQGLEK